ncbi:putative translation initiation factor SUI1 [gamma proteobacterium NOR5-3]|nr:putative translation initiation factor SUI1 [gamma proteobacterium NOR5-3]
MGRSGEGKSRLVYSTDKGRLCPECGTVKADCRCRLLQSSAPKGDGIVRLKRETKGRGGKAVTLVIGLPDDLPALKARTKALKQRCGVGGAIKDGVIEIQGDQRELIKSVLESEGFTVKIAGG